MLRILCIEAVIAVLRLASAVVADQPIVTNGGFEAVKGSLSDDWSPVVSHPDNRCETTTDAHTGRRALRLSRVVDEGEVGFNRAWEPRSGKQGTMLSRRKGGLVFWYKVVRMSDDAQMELMAIPMNAQPFEESPARRTIYTVPRAHVGDDTWHRAVFKYDYTANPKVKWIHVSGRLNRGTGEVLVDDVSFLRKVGPLVEVADLAVTTIGKAEEERFRVSCTVTNRGDEPADALSVKLIAPKACQTTSGKDGPRAASLSVDGKQPFVWELRGRRSAGDKLAVAIQGASVSVREEIELQPRLEARLIPAESILFGDARVKLSAHIENTGTAAASAVRWLVTLAPAGALKLHGQLAPWKAKPVLLPGQIERPDWQIEPLRAVPRATATLVVSGTDVIPAMHSQEFVCLSAVNRNRPRDERWRAGSAMLTFYGSELGFGATGVYACDSGGKKGGERLLARIPSAGRVVIAPYKKPPSGVPMARDDEVIDFFGELTATKDHASIVAYAKDEGGADWRLAVRFTPGPATDLVRVHYELRCKQDRQVRAFEGPIVWAGEGSFGTKKRDAVVPGIEWLVDGEISSSDLDFEPSHRHRIRYVPHPNELTWPVMALVNDQRGIGLMWDPDQRFDGQRRGPQPVFASPDHFSHRNHHLMGLMLPTVREMKERNVRRSPKPILLKGDQAWTLTADLWVAADARDSLAALDSWMDVHSLPEPLSPPRGDWPKEISFSMAAYLQTLYDPNVDGWIGFVGGPAALLGKPGPRADFGFDVWMGSHLADDAGAAKACKTMVDRLFVQPGRPVGATDAGFIMGRPDRVLDGQAAMVAQLVEAQGPDGEWRFDADHKDTGVFAGYDYHELGEDNAVEVGICARKAYEILLLARMTGDRCAYRAGLKALAYMKRFEVPRAAQVWEVPVHSPDILAAADAVDAYLEAYQIDGKVDHLVEARRWARAGLPFVYVWHVPEFPWMQYGSIPVFGASWMKWSWIANLVQWNGLRYAYALIKLARCDESRPWLRVARGLTISAMHQQHPDGKLKALWPDSIRVDGPGRSGWEFAPRLILKNVYALMGRDEEPITRRVDGLVISVVGVVRNAERKGRDLNVDVEIPSPLTSWLVVAGTSEPAGVRLNGEALSPLPTHLTVLSKVGYVYRFDVGLLVVALPTSGQHRITITGVEPRPVEFVPQARNEIAFDFDRDAEGWKPRCDLIDWRCENGRLVMRSTGGDPYLGRSALRVPADRVKVVTICMKVDRGAHGQFYWTTDASPNEAEDKVIVFALRPGQMHEYRLSVGQHSAWKGREIRSVRIDPTDQPGAQIEIDWVRGK